MKKLNYILAFAFIFSLGLFTSCTEDEDPNPPTINISDPLNNPTYTPGSSVQYQITVSSNEDLQTFWVEESTNSNPISEFVSVNPADAFEEGDLVNFANNMTSVTIVYEYFIPTDVAAGTTITLDVEVEDKETDAVESVSFDVVSGNSPINSYGPSTMGSWTSSTGSYYATADGMVYTQSEVTGHEAEIDFVFYYGTTNGATLCAPNDAELQAGGTLESNYVCKDWATKNATKFGSNVTVTWADITDDEEIAGTTATASAATQLAVDNVIPFETAAGKKGLVKVNAISGGVGDGEITFEIKVQQ